MEKKAPKTVKKKTPDATEKIVVFNPNDELPSVVRRMTAGRLLDIVSLAENGDTRELFALYRDVIVTDNQIQTEFLKRKAAVLGDAINIVPWDKTSAADISAKERCWRIVDTAPFREAQDWLLNATLYPVAAVEKVFSATESGYALSAIVPVHYQLLDYRSGALKIFDTDKDGRPLSTSHDPDPARYIVHRSSMLPLPDRFGGPMRSILFWWLLRTMSRQWWADLLERYGVPFLKGKYSDDEGRKVLERAFRMAVRLGAIVISKGTEAEIVQAAASDKSDSHERFIELCNREISKLVTGQTLSTQASPTGELGSGTANLQSQVRDDLRKMDARQLANTMRAQLLVQFCAINGELGNAPVLMFGSDSVAETQAMIATIKSLSEAGFEPDDDGIANLSERIGFGIRRKEQRPTMFPFSATPLSVGVQDRVAPSVSSDLAKAFRGHLAPVAALIRESSSPEDCLNKVRAWALSANASNVREILENALVAYAAAGARSATQ